MIIIIFVYPTFLTAVIMGYLKLGDWVQALRERKRRRRGREEGAGHSVVRWLSQSRPSADSCI